MGEAKSWKLETVLRFLLEPSGMLPWHGESYQNFQQKTALSVQVRRHKDLDKAQGSEKELENQGDHMSKVEFIHFALYLQVSAHSKFSAYVG